MLLKSLKKWAQKYTVPLGHKMRWDKSTAELTELEGECKICGRKVTLELNPLSHSPAVTGDALEIPCGQPLAPVPAGVSTKPPADRIF